MQSEHNNTKKYLFLIILAIGTAATVISFLHFYNSSNQVVPIVPKVTLTPPLQPFSLTLTTSTPTVDIPVKKQSTQFEMTLTKNGNSNLQFPCSVTVHSSLNLGAGYSPLVGITGYRADGYGSGQCSIDYNLASVYGFKGNYVQFYATATDTYGVTITSNTVTVEYYGNGLSPNT